MGQKDKCEVRLLACRIFLNSGCVYKFIHLLRQILALFILFISVSHTQLAAYLNFFECSGTVELKKKTLLEQLRNMLDIDKGMSLIIDTVACGGLKNRQLEVHG